MRKGTGHMPAKERARLRAERAANRKLSEAKLVPRAKPAVPAPAPKKEPQK